MSSAKFIIEHLEPDMFEWCVLEYRHMSEIVGKENLIFTNVKNGGEKISSFGEVISEKFKDLNYPDVCVLDPAAKKELTPSDAKKFKYFVFGGILGDYPPRKRTGEELGNVKGDRRNLGKEQMSTDTAVLVVKKIIVDGMKLRDILFKDHIVIETAKNEEVEMPYRYVLDSKGKPILPKGLIEHLKKEETF